MVAAALSLFALLLVPVSTSAKSFLSHAEEHELLRAGPARVGLYQALTDARQEAEAELAALGGTSQLPFLSKHKAYCHPQPISHFDEENKDTFCQRYWFDAQHWQPGGPVFVLDGGETSGANRLPFLETGIIARLAKEFNGVAVVLEHRYYGSSLPFGDAQNFTTDSLRFLNNAEALEDSAVFMRDVRFPGIEPDLSAGPGKATPWIYYGGSYAGARAAHMRKLYPDLVFGAIASSAVTHAQVFYPEYMDAIRQWGPKECIANVEASILYVDAALDDPRKNHGIKKLFGLSELPDDDFASVLSHPLGGWQGRNWDPKIGSTGFYDFCDALAQSHGKKELTGKARVREVVENYGRWVDKKLAQKCPKREFEADLIKKKVDVVACFGTHNATKFQSTDVTQTWRLWMFQVCTQWGYFQGAPATGPRIVSNRLTLEYESKLCKQAFQPGIHITVPETPDVAVVNNLGDFGLSYDRLAFIDGDSDPWRPATPQSDAAPRRNDTILQPMKIIEDAVHHYDENGLAHPSQEPARIRKVHEEEIAFIAEWLKDFKP